MNVIEILYIKGLKEIVCIKKYVIKELKGIKKIRVE